MKAYHIQPPPNQKNPKNPPNPNNQYKPNKQIKISNAIIAFSSSLNIL